MLYFGQEQKARARPQSAVLKGYTPGLAPARTSLGACNGTAARTGKKSQRPQSAGVVRHRPQSAAKHRNQQPERIGVDLMDGEVTEEQVLAWSGISERPSASNVTKNTNSSRDHAAYDPAFDFTSHLQGRDERAGNKTQLSKNLENMGMG
eukprot:TRINITY_DN5007_c0_g2_i2.p1 TRINITY_DN5007_c0_g2~~TRINITY_DN5007_c0_g2_i2.p1  ORF type:complete len:150 (-),score=8.26 TRINITY_DN5007_c0_g2_i2:146-595(-)